MGFGTEMQGQQSHEQLLNLQQFELKLLQTIRHCVLHRIQCEKQYAKSLADMINIAKRFENVYTFNTPLYKAWTAVVNETENLASVVKANADAMCSKTIEKLVNLIEEKKTLKIAYTDDRKRLDDEFKKAKDELNKLQIEYQRAMIKLHLDRSKYEEATAKGKPATKVESAKQKYLQTTEKLHRTHNDYVLALNELTVHQKDYSRVLLPGLLDCQQEVQETMVQQSKDILIEFSSLTDTSSDEFAKCHSDIHKSIASIKPSGEYDEFLDKCRSDPIPPHKHEFQDSLLESYTGSLKANEIVVDELSEKHLQNSCSRLTERLDLYTERKNTRDKDLQACESQLSQHPDLDSLNYEEKMKYYTQKKSAVNLRREKTEAHSHIEKLKNVINMVKEPISKLEGNIPAVDLENVQVDMPTTSREGWGDGLDSGAEGFSQSAKDKFSTITKQMKIKLGKKKQTEPPKLPSKDFFGNSSDGAAGAANSTLNTDNKEDENTAVSSYNSKRAITQSTSLISNKYEQCDVTMNLGSNKSEPTKQNNGQGPNKKWTIHDAQWFHGVLPRDEVVRLLQNDGDYLVRESKNKKTGEPQYVLSAKWQEGKHFIIQGEEGNWRFEGDSFPTILKLVEHQLECGEPVTKKSHTILKNPILREEWELNNDEVVLGAKLGNGNFGDVFKGKYKKEEVAVKTCKEALSDDQKKKFLQEGRILKQYNHPNIVRFIGIAAQRQPVMILMEYVPGGALLTFLRKMEKNPSLRATPKALIKMCVDAAAGMAYLEDKNCIHRDLAARNCLVGKENVVKISDFGMSREEEEYTVSGGLKQIPIKWTAPEALNFGTYTSACDVWSYGILMWEIFSLGNTPYSGLTNNQAREKVDEGYRMPAPESTPTAAYTVMEKCWAGEPKDRPKFEQTRSDLYSVWESL